MPDLPAGPFVAWNKVGKAVWLNSNEDLHSELSQGQMDALVRENASAIQSPIVAAWLVALFPELELAGFLGARALNGQWRTAQYSLDTTNGADGTWTNLPGATDPGWVGGLWRDGIVELDPVISGVRGVRFGSVYTLTVSHNWNRYNLCHVYGWPINPADRLELWHPTSDERLDPNALKITGDLTRGVDQVDVDFRVKNRSATLTANTITVDLEQTVAHSPTTESWHELSLDSGAFQSSVEITSLAPGAISDVVTLRREPPSNAPLGYQRSFLNAVPASWTS